MRSAGKGCSEGRECCQDHVLCTSRLDGRLLRVKKLAACLGWQTWLRYAPVLRHCSMGKGWSSWYVLLDGQTISDVPFAGIGEMTCEVYWIERTCHLQPQKLG